jgi:16S rRNA (uracil1498-N3)-methyltransferase
VIPTIKALESFQEAIGQSSANQLKILLSPDVKESLDRFVNQTTPQNIQIAIGPEGGFSPEEETFAKQMGYQILSLGPRILRTETAGIVAITAVNTIWNLKRGL